MTGDWKRKPAESIDEKTLETNDKRRKKATRLIDEKPPNLVGTEEENQS